MDRRKIMIMDDDAGATGDIRTRLVKYGHTVPRCAGVREEALDALAGSAPELVLMDIRLAGRLLVLERKNRLLMERIQLLARPAASLIMTERPVWPLTIKTLGGFGLARDGADVKFTGKVQHKPLALLKALIAFGGRDVPEEQFTDALWPEADGDLAHGSFEMAVHRLRKLIGHSGFIQLRERKLSLDAGVCRVDAWEFEQAVENAEHGACNEAGGRKGEPETEIELFEKALSLYKGHFLASDPALSWAFSCRERLRSKFIRLVMKFGTHLERAKQWESAAEVFQRGLEIDDRTEEFYQQLMVCHRKLGRSAEAMAVYNRCRALLSSAFGVTPSVRIEEIHQSIKKGQNT